MKAHLPIIFTFLAFPAFGWAGETDAIYIGGSIGQSNIDGTTTEAGVREDFLYIDEYTSGYKLIIGYVYHLIPFIDVGIEADYREFGVIDSVVGQDYGNGQSDNERVGDVVGYNQYTDGVQTTRYRQDISALNVYGLVGINLGKMGVFAKYGSSFNNSDIEAAGNNILHSGYSPTYGVGLKFQLGNIAVRSEYEVMDFKGVGGDFMYMFSIGGTANF